MKLLVRLRRLVRSGLEATAPLWPPIQAAYAFVHRAAHLLANHAGGDSMSVRQAYQELLTELRAAQASLGPLVDAAIHFRTVTASYWPGLFACYDVPDLPRTNNDLEHYFGTARHLERRATGRKGASPALVVRGSVRVVAAVATRFAAPDAPLDAAALALRPQDLAAWKQQRREVEERHATRRAQARFRRDPAAYLTGLENTLLKPALPP
jgi:hypothetical protein